MLPLLTPVLLLTSHRQLLLMLQDPPADLLQGAPPGGRHAQHLGLHRRHARQLAPGAAVCRLAGAAAAGVGRARRGQEAVPSHTAPCALRSVLCRLPAKPH